MKALDGNVGGRLDRLPVSSFHYRLFGLIAAGMFFDAFEIYLGAGVLAALVDTGWSDLTHNGTFVSATFAGMMLGAWFAGWIGDRYGRRFAYQLNLLIFGLASFAAALSPSIGWLIVARFIIGVGLGAEIVVGYVLLSEFMPAGARSRWGSALAAVTTSALFFSALGGFLIIPTLGWRWMFGVTGIGALCVWGLRRNLPESPRWLEAQGRKAEAETILAAIEGRVSVGPAPTPAPAPVSGAAKETFWELFKGAMLPRTLVGSLILVTLNTAMYGFIAWLPTFMVKQGMNLAASLWFTTLMSLGGPLGALVAMHIGDRIGRKAVFISCSVATVSFAWVYSYPASNAVFAIAGFLLVTCVYAMVAIAFALYVPESFSTNLRMRGAGFCNGAGRFATIITPQIIPLIFVASGLPGVVAALSGLLLIQAIVIWLFGAQAKQGSLEALHSEPMSGAGEGSIEEVPGSLQCREA